MKKKSLTTTQKIRLYKNVLKRLYSSIGLGYGICIAVTNAMYDLFPDNYYRPTDHLKYKPIKTYDYLYWFPDEYVGDIQRIALIKKVLIDLRVKHELQLLTNDKKHLK